MAHQKIQLCGDSITQGVLAGVLSVGYRQTLYNSLKAANVDFEFVGNRNLADSMPGTDGWRSLCDGWPGYKVSDLQSVITPSAQGGGGGAWRSATLVCLLIGTNDILGGDTTITSNVIPEMNLTALMMTMYRNNPGCAFILCKLPPTASDAVMTPLYGYSGCNARVTAYNAALPDVCDRARQWGIDVTLIDAGLTQSDLQTDGVHPTDTTGYPKIGNAFSAAVQAFCARTPPFRPNPNR